MMERSSKYVPVLLVSIGLTRLIVSAPRRHPWDWYHDSVYSASTPQKLIAAPRYLEQAGLQSIQSPGALETEVISAPRCPGDWVLKKYWYSRIVD